MREALIVFKKEIREMLRDKRVRSAMFFGPAFSVLLTMMMFGMIMSSVSKATKTKIHVIKGERDTPTKAFIEVLEKAGMTIEELQSKQEAEEKIKKGDVRLALDFGTGMQSTLAKPAPYTIQAYLDPTEQKSQIALGIIEKATSEVSTGILKGIFVQKGINEAFVKPLSVKRNEVKVGETNSNEFLVMLLPYLIVIWAFYGAFSSASDIVSGEKERQTLETLLISPAARRQIAYGKLAALTTASLCAIGAAVGTLLLLYVIKLSMLNPLFEKGLGLSFTGLLVIIVTLVPTAVLFGSALLAVSSFARNTREAQTYLAQASVFVMLPAVFSQIIGLTEFANSKAVYAIPILNVTNVIRNALLGRYDTVGILITIVMGIVFALVATGYSIKLFNREAILNRI